MYVICVIKCQEYSFEKNKYLHAFLINTITMDTNIFLRKEKKDG